VIRPPPSTLGKHAGMLEFLKSLFGSFVIAVKKDIGRLRKGDKSGFIETSNNRAITIG
jgi:hypothetical protein